MLPQTEIGVVEKGAEQKISEQAAAEQAVVLPEDILVDRNEEAKSLFGSESNKEDLSAIADKLFADLQKLNNLLFSKKLLEQDVDSDFLGKVEHLLEELKLNWSFLDGQSQAVDANTYVKIMAEKTSNLLSEVLQRFEKIKKQKVREGEKYGN